MVKSSNNYSGVIYPPELQLIKANTSDTEVPFLDLHLSIFKGLFHPKFMINAITLILPDIVYFAFWMALFLGSVYFFTYKIC